MASSLYTPIKDWQTRLLVLYPGQAGSLIRTSLVVVDIIHAAGVVIHELNEKVQYYALSYCWGSSDFNCEILCNDAHVFVTQGLHDALQHMRRSEGKIKYAWVDALCINQADFDERSMQVANMLTIYTKAEVVVVWLGELGLELTQMHIEYALAKHDQQSGLRKAEYDLVLKQLLLLARSPYFTRIWVRQEVWAASKILVQWDDLSLPWHVFADLMEAADVLWSRTHSNDSPFDVLLHGFARPTLQQRMQIYLDDRPHSPHLQEIGHDMDIRSVLNRCSGAVCSDARDHVYGLLGMTSVPVKQSRSKDPFDDPHMMIDYNKSVAEVYSDVARYIMVRDKALNVLFLTAAFGMSADRDDIPSWVPDWHHATYSADWLAESIKGTGRIAAGYCSFEGSLDVQLLPHTIDFSSSLVLSIRGWKLGILGSFLPDSDARWPVFLIGKKREFPRLRHAMLEQGFNCNWPWPQIEGLKDWLEPWKAGEKRNRRGTRLSDVSRLDPELCNQSGDARRLMDEQEWFSLVWAALPDAREGDILVAVKGGIHPIVLRPVEGSSSFVYIGPATVSTTQTYNPQHENHSGRRYDDDITQGWYDMINLLFEFDEEVGEVLEPFSII